jgi:pyruvate dehydrogenase E2 component (dihydrolipoamide acetyltransferase)
VRVEFELPDIEAATGDKIVVAFWHVEEDEEFVEGNDLMEVSTHKATFNISASSTGKLVEILVREGDAVEPGDAIAIIDTGDN